MTREPIPVWHIITGLDAAGAEFNLYRLLSATDRREFPSTVVSLQPSGLVKPLIEELGIPVQSLDMVGLRDAPGGVLRLRKMLKEAHPHVVQTWMDHADFFGGIAARAAKIDRLVWGIQNTEVDPSSDRTSRLLSRLNSRMSDRVPRAIVANSERGLEAHVRLGYPRDKLRVIHSGFETPQRDFVRVNTIRESWHAGEDQVVIGRVGRFSPIKDPETFIAAARMVTERHPETIFVMCGEGVDESNPALLETLRRGDMAGRVLLLGHRTDILDIHAALDIAVSSSLSEGFPGVVAEAMSVGTPAVVTDAGDSRLLVGDTGTVVAAGDPAALAAACSSLVERGRSGCASLGELARQRIRGHFSLERMAELYAGLYREMADA